ncbi:MAG: hypothetical protein IJW67_12485 [Blautia sp.]|nr:hypothetical protein [Blautia sp.]
MDEVSKDRINTAIDMVISLVVNEISAEDHVDASIVMSEFLASQTARMLYDEKTKLWWDGPSDIVERYREEKNLNKRKTKPAIRFAGFTDP